MAESLSVRKWELGNSKSLAKRSSLSPPCGFIANGDFSQDVVMQKTDVDQLKHKRAWAIALSVGKSLPMNMFMMWMMGNALSMWTLMFLIMILRGPFTAMMSGFNAFDQLDKTQSFLPQKAAFVMLNIASLGLGVYKCYSIGLIPKSNSDFLEFEQQGEDHEYSFGGYI